RSFCPSCQKRRQLEFAEFCVREVLAPVPHRQVVLSIPKRIRLHFFRNRKLLSKLARCGWETVRDFLQAAVGRDDVIPGAVVAIQTFGNLADLTPHLHMIVSWGCFDENGTFYAVRQAPDEEMIEQVFRHRVFRMLLDEEAVTEELVKDLLAWRHSGFSAYVGNAVPARDAASLESLAQYIVRGAVAQERLSVSEGLDGTSRVTYRSKKVHPGHGANFRILDALDFIALLVAHIPWRHEKRAINYG
ncbi:transposase, partial [Planctomycetota bacterium]